MTLGNSAERSLQETGLRLRLVAHSRLGRQRRDRACLEINCEAPIQGATALGPWDCLSCLRVFSWPLHHRPAFQTLRLLENGALQRERCTEATFQGGASHPRS